MQQNSSRVMLLLALLVSLVAGEGCYYGHLAVGQTRMLLAREPIEELLAQPDLDVELRSQLERVGEARRYAEELGLDVGKQYTSYVEGPGERVVTTVGATRPGEIEAGRIMREAERHPTVR